MIITIENDQTNFISLIYWSKTKYGLRDTVPVIMSLIDGVLTLQSGTGIEYSGSIHEATVNFHRSKLFDEGTLVITTPDRKQYVLGRMPKPLSPLPSNDQLALLLNAPLSIDTSATATDAPYTGATAVIKTMEDRYALLQAWQEVFINNKVSFTPTNLEFKPNNQARRFVTISLVLCIIVTIIVSIWFWDIFPV